MKFSIISIELVESYGDTAWDINYQAGIDIDNGKILYPDNFNFNKNAEYTLQLNLFEEQNGFINKVDELESRQEELFISSELLKFLKIHLLNDKLEEKLVVKNQKEKTHKI